jgi:hypothetical protein
MGGIRGFKGVGVQGSLYPPLKSSKALKSVQNTFFSLSRRKKSLPDPVFAFGLTGKLSLKA